MFRAIPLAALLAGTLATVAAAQPVDEDDRPVPRRAAHVQTQRQSLKRPASHQDEDDARPSPPVQIQKQPEAGQDEDDARPVSPPAVEIQKQRDAGQGADDDDEEAQPASPIVVTARRLDSARTSIDQGLGATVYELNNETVESRPGGETGTIGATLSQTPGITLSSSGLSIRGSNAVQVRINDVILPEAISDPEDRLSSRFAQSTRLITGTLPAQFGFAPGGVVAVTTKNGLYQHGGQAELFAGSHRMFEPAFEWGGSADSSSLFASGSLESGESRVVDVTGQSTRDSRRQFGGLAFADHVIDPQDRVSLILGGSNERDKIGATDLPAGIERTGDSYAVGTVQHSLEDFTVQASLFAGHAADSDRFAQAQHETRGSLGTQIDSALETGVGNTIRAGLLLTRSTEHESGDFVDVQRAGRTSLGLYAGDEWKPVSRLTINAGVRADWLRNLGSGATLEPRASLVWESPHGFSAHAGYARYASAPPLGEERVRLPNERDDYIDAGAQQKLGPLTLGIDGYLRSAHDLIVEHRVPGEAIASAFAFRRGRFRGVELSATYARGPVNAWANLSLSKSQGRSIIGDEPFPAAAANGRWVNLASDHPVIASAGISWRAGKLNLSGDVLAGSGSVRTLQTSAPNAARAPAFATFGLAAVYHARLFDQPLDLRADLTNLTNVRYRASDAANLEGGWTRFAQGRSVLVGFEQGF